MNIQLTPSLVLTNERCESRYGIPVLVNRQDEATAYGPADIIDVDNRVQPAAQVVARFARTIPLNTEEREAVSNYLRQWPDGPQLDGEL